MGKYTKYDIKVPDVNRSFSQGDYKYSNPSTIKVNIGVLNKIVSEYKNFINIWGEEFEIDNSILVSFIATESGGLNLKPNKYERVLLPPRSAHTLRRWQRAARAAD